MSVRTKGELVSDLELRFTEGAPSADFEIDQDQIAFWLDVASNALLSDYLSKQMRKGEDIDPQYITKSAMITPASESVTGVNAASQRYQIDISTLNILPIRGFSRDHGVIRVSDDDNNFVTNIRYEDSDFYNNLWFAKADKDNSRFLWYREGGNIFLDGIDSTNYTTEDFRVFYIEPVDSSGLASTAVYPLGDDLVPLVLDIAEEIGWKELQKGIYDIKNDGIQN